MLEGLSDLYATETWLQAALVTLVLGGGAAWQTGRAIAATWRPLWHLIAYTLLLGAAVRFVHFALFEADLLSPAYFIDTAYLLAVGCLSWRSRRAGLMVTQYPWLYVRSGLLGFRERGAGEGPQP